MTSFAALRCSSTGGLGASSSVASAALSGASRQRLYPVAGYEVFKEQIGKLPISGIPSAEQIGPGCCS